MPVDRPKHALLSPDLAPAYSAPSEASPLRLAELGQRSEEFRHLLMHLLLPLDLMAAHDIDPITWRNAAGSVMVETATAEDGHIWGLRLLNDVDPRDPLIEVELTDTVFSRISVTWVGINDPFSPRFDIDRDDKAGTTLRGVARRNLTAETAALLAGLAPGQVRRGLGMLGQLLGDLEKLLAALHQYDYEAEPLFYHNALLFERHGFHYIRGRELMQRIHEGFAAGGYLAAKLDESTPFRDPALAHSIRGRSWAIHDGILDEPWDGVKLGKRIGRHTHENTAPAVPW